MKKLFLIVLGMLLMLGVSATAFATDVTISGEITVRGEASQNTTDFRDDHGDNAAFYDEKIRLRFDAKVSPNTSGVIELMTAGFDPYGGAVDKQTWGSNPSGATGYGEGNTWDSGFAGIDNIGFREAYILHQGSGLLGYNAGMKVGRMAVKLGRGLFLDHTEFGDEGITLFVEPSKETQVSFTTLKLNENNPIANGGNTVATDVPENDDVTAYTIAVSHATGGANLSADITYVDDQDFVGALPSGPGAPGAGWRTGTAPLHLWNIGLRGDTTVSSLTLYGDVELQYGKAEKDYRDRVTNATVDRKLRGYAWMLGADADVAGIKANLEIAYGSGDKCNYSIANANDVGDLGSVNCDSGSKNEAFLTSLGADQQHYTYVYEDRAPSAFVVNPGGVRTVVRATGLSNTWYVKLGADKEINPDLNVGGDIYYLKASKSTNINTFVNAAKNANNTIQTSKDIGWEVDANMKYKIDTNLFYFIEAGYLFAGNAYDMDNPDNATIGQNISADNTYVLRHGISLTF